MSRIMLLLFLLLVVKSIAIAETSFDGDRLDAKNTVSGGLVEYHFSGLLSNYNPGGCSRKSIPPTITLSGNPFESRIAQLNWVTSDPSLDGIYYVERDTAASGLWVVLKQLPYNSVLQYSDTITDPYCIKSDISKNFSYRIRFVATISGEIAYSNVSDLVLWDQTNPVNVENIIVSINSGFPLVSWKQITGDAISGYEIQRFNGTWPPITTLSPDSSSYLDLTVSDVCDQSYAYVIVAIDQCENRSVPSYVPVIQTIKLDVPPIDECERLAKLSWNPYHSMPGGLGGYKVFRDDNGLITEIANITDTLQTAFTDNYQFENGHNYIYFVQAYSASGLGVSLSCKEGSTFMGANIPDSVYITKVSVENNSYIKIDYYSAPVKTVKKLLLERSDDGITFAAIDSLSVPGDFVPQQSYFEDKTADPSSKSYYYRLKTNDFCGTNSIYSNISRTVYVQCTSSATQNTIDWNSYASWLKDVEGYKVYRTVDGQPLAGELLGSVTSVTQSFPDLLTGVDPTKQVCYWVVAAENPGNPYLANATSVSNISCIDKGATVFMPTAFRPQGLNNRFRPVATFVDPQKFKMTIFNRWGQQFFETTDMVNGWDGKISGSDAPQGLYAYIITYSSFGGEEYTIRGTVYVMR